MSNPSFDSYCLSEPTLTAISQRGYTTPTPVQDTAIPLLMSGIDLIIQSQTGTGKTAAYVIPAVELLTPNSPIEVLIIVPTRELANQVHGEFEQLGKNCGVRSVAVYGGISLTQQIGQLKTANVVCATPGRLLDLLRRRALTVDNLSIFVLDEADELLSMGFEKELNAIMEFIPTERQTLLLSATVTEDIKRIAHNFLKNPEFISFSEKIAIDLVHHHYYLLSGVKKQGDLLKIIEVEDPEQALIFCNTKEDSLLVTNFLKRHGLKAEVLNGDLPQNERERALKKLKNGIIRFLCSTDLAARGIDIAELPFVINYSLPESPEIYVHRTGRTGRAGNKGIAISLVSPREIGIFYTIRRIFKIQMSEQLLPSDEEVKALQNSRALKALLDPLWTQDIQYGKYLALAQYLLSKKDAVSEIAKLLGFYDNSITTIEKITENSIVPTPQIPQAKPKPILLKQQKRTSLHPQKPVLLPQDKIKDIPKKEVSKTNSTKELVSKETKKQTRVPLLPPSVAKISTGTTVAAKKVITPKPQKIPPKPQDSLPKSLPKTKQKKKTSQSAISKPISAPDKAPIYRKSPQSITTMHINMGTNFFVNSKTFLDFICEMSGMDEEDFGAVKQQSCYSLVEVRSDLFHDVIEAINEQIYMDTIIKAAPARKS